MLQKIKRTDYASGAQASGLMCQMSGAGPVNGLAQTLCTRAQHCHLPSLHARIGPRGPNAGPLPPGSGPGKPDDILS